VEGDLTYDEWVSEVTEWASQGDALEMPKWEDGWFSTKTLMEGGMTEWKARACIKALVKKNMVEIQKFSRTQYYKKV